MSGSLCDLLRKSFELPVQELPSLPFLLFEFNLVFIAITILALAIASLIELNVRGFPVELDILLVRYSELKDTRRKQNTYMSLLLANHDRSLQVNVHNDKKFMVARLEEQVLDIAEQDICTGMSDDKMI